MNTPRLYNGGSVDNASLEIRIDEAPYTLDVHAFVAQPPHRAELAISMEAFTRLVSLLGGAGKDGHDYMRKEWEFTLSFAQAGVPTQIVEVWKKVVIAEESTKIIVDPKYGSWMAKRLTVEALSVHTRYQPVIR